MSVLDVFREVDEDVRRERAIAFWRRYGIVVFAAMLVVMAGVVAFQQYQKQVRDREVAQTIEFEALLSGIAPGSEQASAEALAAYAARAKPAQATLALFTEAALRQRAGNVIGAQQIYHQIADGGQAESSLRDLAVVRLGYLAVDAAKPEPLIPRLQEIAGRNSPWRYDAREAIALLTAKTGQRDAAAKMFSDLAGDPGAPPDMAGRARALAELYSGK